MSKKRVLFVSQEMNPYTEGTASDILNQIAPYTYNKGYEVRVLMPRFGLINERRHRLHEVVRLSGMNIIVDDDDFPLIIKVASLPGSRMQVYFLDNEEFFKRKFTFDDAEGKPFDDNADRMVFFCKGVMETVKKFGWAPDIIHCHGWMTSLVPAYMKKIYRFDPIFENSKTVYSIYDRTYADTFDDTFFDKATINNLEKEDLAEYIDSDKISLHYGAIQNSDALISVCNNNDEINTLFESSELPKIVHQKEEFETQYLDFYNSLVEE